MPVQSPSATTAPLAQPSPTNSTSTKETSNEVSDPLARYVHSNWLVYESLVAYVRGDDPLKDASNERVRALQDAKAADAYLSFWRHRYEIALAFLRTRPAQVNTEANYLRTTAQERFPTEESRAVQFANEDARALFGNDPVAQHDAKQKLEAMRAVASHQLKIDESQISALRKAWEAEQRAGFPLYANDAVDDASRYSNLARAIRISNSYAHGVVRNDLDAVVRINVRINDLSA